MSVLSSNTDSVDSLGFGECVREVMEILEVGRVIGSLCCHAYVFNWVLSLLL